MKPFIHLFETPKNYYFYDVNRNENVQVNSKLYQYLYEKSNDDNSFIVDEKLEEEIEKLQKQGYLLGNSLEKMEHPATGILGLFLERSLNMLILQLTQACNLRCVYCNYTSNDGTNRLHNKCQMSWDLPKQSIDYYKDRVIDLQEITINFYGGEPLLEFELLKKCVDYSNQVFKGKEINYYVTTNGTLLDDQKAKYLNDNDFHVLVSLDGTKKTNDKNRQFINNRDSVFDVVMTNIENISKKHKNLFSSLSINMVLDPSLPFVDYIKVFDEFGFLKKVKTRITIIDDSSLVNKNQVSPEFVEQYYYYEFLSYLYAMGKIDLENEYYLIDNYLVNCRENLDGLIPSISLGKVNAPSGPCLPGKQRLMVNVEGKIFPCEKVSEIIERNCIGTIKDGLDLKRAQDLLNVSRLNENNCKDCFAFRHCTLCAKSYECTLIDKDNLVDICNRCRSALRDKLIDIEILNEIRYDIEFHKGLQRKIYSRGGIVCSLIIKGY